MENKCDYTCNIFEFSCPIIYETHVHCTRARSMTVIMAATTAPHDRATQPNPTQSNPQHGSKATRPASQRGNTPPRAATPPSQRWGMRGATRLQRPTT